ncbi:MAG: DUF1565 domain-containing protein [Phycisphaera sp.]|nr:DUF1565 domain-containing protein [Phycisphaera sp.]
MTKSQCPMFGSRFGARAVTLGIGAWALVIAASGVTFADTIHVPKDHATIQAAIDAAKAGDTVLVAAGTYRERVKLKDGVTLRSAGDDTKGKLGLARAEATVIDGGGAIEGNDHPAVEMAEGATLDGFSVTNAGAYDDKLWQHHYDTHGNEQSHAHIGNFGVPGVGVTGVNCTLVNNIVHHNGSTGIAIRGVDDKRCAPVVRNNVTYRNMGGGIGSMHGSTAWIESNTCFENFYAGIGHDDASPIVVNNTCYDNVRAGIGVSEGACPVVRDNKCYKNRRAGIGIRTGAETRPVVENNHCYENDMAGIGVEEEAEPIIRGNHCERNTLAGIGCREGAKPIVIANNSHDNGASGVGADGGEPIVIDNVCKANKSAGLGVSNGAKAILVGNVCEDNGMVALGVPGDSEAIAIGNTLSRTGGMPPIVAIRGGGKATLVGNTIRGGGIAAVIVEGNAHVIGNDMEGAGRNGVWVWAKSEAVIVGNTFRGYQRGVNADQAGESVVDTNNKVEAVTEKK